MRGDRIWWFLCVSWVASLRLRAVLSRLKCDRKEEGDWWRAGENEQSVWRGRGEHSIRWDWQIEGFPKIAWVVYNIDNANDYSRSNLLFQCVWMPRVSLGVLFIYLFSCGNIAQKKLCVLIAPRAHEDKDKSVNGGAKNGVKWCIAIPVLGLELL